MWKLGVDYGIFQPQRQHGIIVINLFPKLTVTIIFTIVCLQFIHSSSGLECYNCRFIVIGNRPSGDPNCVEEPELSNVIETCDQDNQFVYHTCQETFVSGLGYFTVTRSCLKVGLPLKDSCVDFVQASHRGKRCYCTSKGQVCNGNKCIGGQGKCNTDKSTTEIELSTSTNSDNESTTGINCSNANLKTNNASMRYYKLFILLYYALLCFLLTINQD